MADRGTREGLTFSWVLMLALLGGGLVLGHLTGSAGWLSALLTLSTEVGLAAGILAAAGGLGYWPVRRLAPASAPGGFVIVSAVALGLWLLSTLVLVLGSLLPGALNSWLWGAVVAVGAGLAVWFARDRLMAFRLPGRAESGALAWVLVALGLAFALGGVLRPSGFIGMASGDAYDVLEYHLQVPREFLAAGRVTELTHNAYSYYPLGMEMLYLLAMALRGGAYEGMYLAKLMPLATSALAVAAAFTLWSASDKARGRFSAVLLATAPCLVYLSWMPLAETGMILYLLLALGWAKLYLDSPSAGPAVLIGAMLGAACAVKYLSVAFVAAPVLVLLAVLVLRRPRQLTHVGAAATVCLVLFAPWLVRNTVLTGNPVFPLGTQALGTPDHWTAETQQRWVAGHGPENRPPVPQPPGWQAQPPRPRALQFYEKFISSHWLGQLAMLLAAGALALMVAGGARPWEGMLAGVLVLQLAIWVAVTHQMPERFIAVAVVPVTQLAAWALVRLSGVAVNPFRRQAPAPEHGPWGLAPAVALLVAAAAVNLVVVYGLFFAEAGGFRVGSMPARDVSRLWMSGFDAEAFRPPPPGSKLMLLGEARAFYYPSNTVYATPFDVHPLAELARTHKTGPEMLAELKRRGVTHLWVNWTEIWRLASTYGYPAELTEGLWQRSQLGQEPDLPVLAELRAAGMTRYAQRGMPQPGPARPRSWQPGSFPNDWPGVTVYAMPWAPQPAPATQPTTAPAAAPATAPATQPATAPGR